MKKSVILLSILLILSLSITVVARVTIGDELDHVVYTEEVLYGDSSLARNVEVETNYDLDYEIFLNNVFTPEEKAEAVTKVSKEDPYADEEYYYGIQGYCEFQIEFYNEFDEPTLVKEEEKNLYEVWKELYESTPNGEIGTKNGYFKDLYAYYPIVVDINLPGFYGRDSEESEMEVREFTKAIQEFLRIPVLDTQEYAYRILKNEDGKQVGCEFSTVGSTFSSGYDLGEAPVVEGEKFDLFLYSVYADDTCYFTFNPVSDLGQPVDVSEIPGGYGIYSFSFDSEKGTLDEESLKMVYVLEEGTLLDFQMDYTKENLLIFTGHEGECFMQVVDAKTLEKKQELSLGELSDEEYVWVWIEEDCIAVEAKYDERIILTPNTDGTYKEEFIVPYRNDVFTEMGYMYLDLGSMDWNGEQLVIGGHLYKEGSENPESYSSPEQSDLYISIYDKSGLLYEGIYHNSLNTGTRLLEYGVFTPGYKGITVRWK